MSVLLRDAVDLLGDAARDQYAAGELADLVYADDTLLIGISKAHLQEYRHAVSAAGERYGMEMHVGKFQMISTPRAPFTVETPDGAQVAAKPSMEHLGAVLHGSGCADHEVSRRIAIATGDFDLLDKTWAHSVLTWKQKLSVYTSRVESKLLYSMTSLVLTAAQRRKVNGFQNRYIRRIIGVPLSYVSRVSNAIVLARASYPLATSLLQKRRLQLLGKILRCDGTHPLRASVFVPHTTIPATDSFIRRVGRPSKEWVKEVCEEAAVLFGSLEAAMTKTLEKDLWNAALSEKLCF